MKVFVVVATQGEYADRNVWVDSVWVTVVGATDHAVKLTDEEAGRPGGYDGHDRTSYEVEPQDVRGIEAAPADTGKELTTLLHERSDIAKSAYEDACAVTCYLCSRGELLVGARQLENLRCRPGRRGFLMSSDFWHAVNTGEGNHKCRFVACSAESIRARMESRGINGYQKERV